MISNFEFRPVNDNSTCLSRQSEEKFSLLVNLCEHFGWTIDDARMSSHENALPTFDAKPAAHTKKLNIMASRKAWEHLNGSLESWEKWNKGTNENQQKFKKPFHMRSSRGWIKRRWSPWDDSRMWRKVPWKMLKRNRIPCRSLFSVRSSRSRMLMSLRHILHSFCAL